MSSLFESGYLHPAESQRKLGDDEDLVDDVHWLIVRVKVFGYQFMGIRPDGSLTWCEGKETPSPKMADAMKTKLAEQSKAASVVSAQ